MKFGFEWTGYVDTNWENPGNWSCGIVPDKYADVKIDGGTVNVNTDAEVRSIYLTPGTQFIVKAGKTFKVLK
jgi:hypothetical protein